MTDTTSVTTKPAFQLHKDDVVVFPNGLRSVVAGVRREDGVAVWFGTSTHQRRPVMYSPDEEVTVAGPVSA
jgi:hypothetical protein